MSSIKMLGMAVIATVGAMAFVGPSSVMAGTSALCAENEEPCSGENLVTHIHFLGLAHISTSPLTVKCHVLFLAGVLGLVTNGPALAHGIFIFSGGCNSGCSATDLHGGLLLVLRTAAGLAEVTGDGFEISVQCAGVVECEYDHQGLAGHALSANLSETAGKVVISQQSLHRTGNPLTNLICPEPAKLDLSLESLADFYVST